VEADLTESMGIGSPSLYAAFGSKEALYLYAEALRHYRENYDALAWTRFNWLNRNMSSAITTRSSMSPR
jgi:hypothetical protein